MTHHQAMDLFLRQLPGHGIAGSMRRCHRRQQAWATARLTSLVNDLLGKRASANPVGSEHG